MSFVHLHIHSEYSLADGSIRIPALIKRVKSLGHKAVALTDHGNLFGAIEFYAKAKSEGLKAIIGAEIYHEGHPPTQAYAKEVGHKIPEIDAFHLILLAKDMPGYKRLIKIVSRAYLENLREVPTVKPEWFEPGDDHLIAMSACLRGEFGYLVKELRRHAPSGNLPLGPEETAVAGPLASLAYQALAAHVQQMLSHFGAGNYYVELIDNNLPEQRRLLPDLVAAAKHFTLPLVASADAHYLDPSAAEAHSVLLAIRNELKVSQIRRRNKRARFHVLGNEEVEEIYGAYPEALANTLKIADACNVKFDFGQYFLPQFPLPEGETAAAALRRMAHERLNERFIFLDKRYGPRFDINAKADYRKRLDYELDVIEKMGFPGYFLIVQDFINWAKAQGIPVGPGRGSGAGSLVAYALRITDLDPIPYNLVFERFLNPERVSMPDFDVDFCQDRRDEVIAYVRERYGQDNVAQITTFGKMLAKAAVRDIGRVMEISYGKVDRIAKMIPGKLPDVKVVTLKDAIAVEPRIQEEADRDDQVAALVKMVADLEGLSRHTSVHAAGIVLSDGPMINYVPVYTTATDGLITQYEMKMAEKVGLVKFDFLGLKTLTVIDHAVKLIRVKRKPDFDINDIPFDAKPVYREISAAHTVGIFQLEGMGMQRLLMKLQPSSFNDIIAVVALFRPGPLGAKMDETYIECKHGRQKPDYLLPQLEGILKETYGVLLYQEQVQKVAASLANYSLGEADLLRRAMGKKIKSEMAAQQDRFVQGCLANQIPESKAQEIFELMAKFADYGFNKSHSAAYGLVSYQTAFLKAYYPEEFMAAIMTCDMDNTSKVTRYMDECRRMKIAVMPPDLNRSAVGFDVVGPKLIGFGLTAIKGVGAGALEPILVERERGGPFKSLDDLARRVNLAKIGKRSMEPLIQVGAFDAFGVTRDELMVVIGDVVKYSETLNAAKSSGQRGLFDEAEGESSESARKEDAPSWSRPVALRNKWGHIEGRPPTAIKWLKLEKKLLGAYVSGHPLNFFTEDVRIFGKATLDHLEKVSGKGVISVVALFQAVNERIIKSGQKMASIRLEDQLGAIECVMFEKDIPPAWPAAGTPVVVYGNVDETFDKTGIRFKLERVMALADVRREQVQQLTIGLPSSAHALLPKLKQILAQNPGDAHVRLQLNLGRAEVLIAPPNLRVDVSDVLLQQLREFPDASVTVTYGLRSRGAHKVQPQESESVPIPQHQFEQMAAEIPLEQAPW